MKNKISFAELMLQNGFQHLGKTTYDGRFIYEREWRKTTDLAWYGEKESTYRIEGYESYGTPIIRLYENGRHEMLNEPNHEAVYADILQWLDGHGLPPK